MREMGIPPDGLAYGALITAYAAAKQPRKAAAVMQDFVDSGGRVSCNPVRQPDGYNHCPVMFSNEIVVIRTCRSTGLHATCCLPVCSHL